MRISLVSNQISSINGGSCFAIDPIFKGSKIIRAQMRRIWGVMA
jgi:hypothetical protein